MGPKGKSEGTPVLQGSSSGVTFDWTPVSRALGLDLLERSHCQIEVAHVLLVGRDPSL